MDEDLRNRLDALSTRLHERARALAHPGKDSDLSQMMVAQAVCLEALRVMGEDIAELRAGLSRQ